MIFLAFLTFCAWLMLFSFEIYKEKKKDKK